MNTAMSLRKYFLLPYIIAAVWNIGVNALLVHALRRLKKLSAISYRFILFQSIADIFAGFTLLSTELLIYLNHDLNVLPKENHEAAKFYSRVACNFFCQFSVIMILIVAIDRYIHMTSSTDYAARMNKFRANILVSMNIVMCISYAALQVCRHLYNFFPSSYTALNIFALVMVVIASGLYYSAYKSISRRTASVNIRMRERESKTATSVGNTTQQDKQRQMSTQNHTSVHSIAGNETVASTSFSVGTETETCHKENRQTAPGETKPSITKRRHPGKQFARAVLGILACTVFSYAPHVILVVFGNVLNYEQDDSTDGFNIAFHVSRLLFCVFPAINAIIFISVNRELRRFVFNTMNCFQE